MGGGMTSKKIEELYGLCFHNHIRYTFFIIHGYMFIKRISYYSLLALFGIHIQEWKKKEENWLAFLVTYVWDHNWRLQQTATIIFHKICFFILLQQYHISLAMILTTEGQYVMEKPVLWTKIYQQGLKVIRIQINIFYFIRYVLINILTNIFQIHSRVTKNKENDEV